MPDMDTPVPFEHPPEIAAGVRELLSGPPAEVEPSGRPVWVVQVAALCAAVAPAFGEHDWPAVVRSLLDDPDDAEVIGVLVPAAAGGFDEPVVLDAEEARVGNGMHRIAAALIAGVPALRVTDRFVRLPLDCVDVEFVLRPLTGVAQAPVDEERGPAAMTWLRSFPLAGLWAQTDIGYGSGDRCGGYWYWPADRVDELVEGLRVRAGARGWQLDVLRAEVVDDDEGDDEDGAPDADAVDDSTEG